MADLQKKFVDIGNVRTKEQRIWYEEIAQKGIDPFSPEHFPKTHPKPILYENDSWFFTENAVPYNDTRYHFLVVCKYFATKAKELTQKMILDLHEILQYAEEEYNLDGHVMCMRLGNTKKTGASVVRLHFHIIAPSGGPDERTAIYPVLSKK